MEKDRYSLLEIVGISEIMRRGASHRVRSIGLWLELCPSEGLGDYIESVGEEFEEAYEEYKKYKGAKSDLEAVKELLKQEA